MTSLRNIHLVLVSSVLWAATSLACTRSELPKKPAALNAPLASTFPRETKLRLGDPQVQLKLALTAEPTPFDIEWLALSGGPKTIEAFRAHALEGGIVGDTPPIHAVFTGLDVKIIAVQVRSKPAMRLATAPGSQVRSLAELRGKKLAYSPGQAQGALVLRALKKAGLTSRDVTLIELESDAFKDALTSRQVDVAPLGGPGLQRYLREYEKEGAGAIDHGVRDNLGFFYVPAEVLADANKAAALRAYVALRTRAQLWSFDHPAEWLEAYYVKDQGLTRAEGQYVIDSIGRPQFPSDWSEAIALTQETVDLLARESGRASFDAHQLFDRRFENVAAEATASAQN
jgi:sulfonate transport system substrate-binding protein